MIYKIEQNGRIRLNPYDTARGSVRVALSKQRVLKQVDRVCNYLG